MLSRKARQASRKLPNVPGRAENAASVSSLASQKPHPRHFRSPFTDLRHDEYEGLEDVTKSGEKSHKKKCEKLVNKNDKPQHANLLRELSHNFRLHPAEHERSQQLVEAVDDQHALF